HRFLPGRTLIREPVLQWEMSPEREPMAKFCIDGIEIPSPEMKQPIIIVPTTSLRANDAKVKADSTKYGTANVKEMKLKLSEKGQTTPIEIDENHQIINGNLRYLAAKKLGQPYLTAIMKKSN